MAAKQKSILSEKILLDALDRVARNPMGYTVLYVNISLLKPKNRHPQFVKIIARLFDSVVGTTKGVMFVLSNGDIAILSKNTPPEIVDEAVKKLREGLAADPILSHDSRDFAKVYSFPTEFVSFYNKIEQLQAQHLNAAAEQKNVKRPLKAEEIDGVIAQLDDIDISELVKRQSILTVEGDGAFHVSMQEFFVAVKDLTPYFPENLDLTADRWLFQYLTQVLDKKTLSAFGYAELEQWPEKISINLNLSSVFSKEFVLFAKNFLKPEQTVVVEVQMMDVLNNLPQYNETKELLHKGGHLLLIDSLNPKSLEMINLEQLQPDMIKLFWEPLMAYEPENECVKAAIEKLGSKNVILAKCDSQEALKWGLKNGISVFQGPFMDNIEAALIRKSCPLASKCTSLECLKRRRLLRGSFRHECGSIENLEKLL